MTIKDRSGQVQILKCKKGSLIAFYFLFFLSWETPLISHCVGLSVSSITLGFSCIFSCLKVEKLGYEYFIDINAPV